jgi:hypothetical protein
LKAVSGATGAEVVAAELFVEFLVAVHDARAAPDVHLGGETLAALAGRLESS